VVCHLQQIHHAQKSRFPRQRRRDIRQPVGVIESTSISPSSIRYRPPTFTWRRSHIRTLHVISPRHRAAAS
jgi:hypothetical protein